MKTRDHRIFSILASLITISLLWTIFKTGRIGDEAELMTFEEALWVIKNDWSEVYPPGSKEQMHVIEQFRTVDMPGLFDRVYRRPVMYREGGDGTRPQTIVAFDVDDPKKILDAISAREMD